MSIKVKKLLSIIMPVYNGMPYLKYAVDSILKQTYQNFQLVIVNDGSIDATKTYLEKLNNSKITIINKHHTGIIDSFNSALELVNTKYVARVDADDYYYPTKFEKQISFLEKNKNVIATGTLGYYMSSKGNISNIKISIPKTNNLIIHDLFNKKRAMLQPSIVSLTKIFKKINGYRPNVYPEDYDLYFRLGLEGKLENIMEPLVAIRIHSSYSSSKLYELMNELDKQIDEYSQRYKFSIDFRNGTNLNKMVMYNRKSLDEYLNGSKLLSAFFLIRGFFANPKRLLSYILNIFKN